MRIWYVHEAKRGWHERNLYLCKEVAKSWREAGHKAAVINVAGPADAEALRKKNATCDVAFVNNFQTVDAMERQGLDILKRSKFRILITGGGWRRPEWVRSSIKAVSRVKANVVCLTHMPHYRKFAERHKKVFHVGLGFDSTVFYPDPTERREGVVFCGDAGMGRGRRLKLLAKTFPGQVRAECGCRWSHARMAQFMRSGSIGWNQIGKGPKDGVSCNLRVWETAGSGLLLLCSRSKHVPLTDGKHYVSWSSDEDLLEKAGYYLNHDAEREKIARQGYEEAVKRHTWRHRALEYKKLVEEHF